MDAVQLKTFIATIPDMHVDKIVKLFVKVRATKSAAQKVFDAQEAEYKAILEACENQLLAAADKAGVTGFSTEFGTTYIAETAKITIADEDAFYGFVKESGDLDFLEHRVSSTHVSNYMKKLVEAAKLIGLDEKEAAKAAVPPPGLNIFRERVMRVRKASEK